MPPVKVIAGDVASLHTVAMLLVIVAVGDGLIIIVAVSLCSCEQAVPLPS